MVSQRDADLSRAAAGPHAGGVGRTDGSLLPSGGVCGLQGGRGEAASDDLLERLFDDKGLRHAPEHVFAGLSERRGGRGIPDGGGGGLFEGADECRAMVVGRSGRIGGGRLGDVPEAAGLTFGGDTLRYAP